MGYLDLKDIKEREIVPGYRAKFVHSDDMTLAFWEIDPGAELPEHNHPHQQISNVLEGKFELTVDGETRILEPGLVAVIPGGVSHGGRAITACKLLDAFHPSRDDYR